MAVEADMGKNMVCSFFSYLPITTSRSWAELVSRQLNVGKGGMILVTGSERGHEMVHLTPMNRVMYSVGGSVLNPCWDTHRGFWMLNGGEIKRCLRLEPLGVE